LLNRDVRLLALESATVVTLEAPVEVVVSRATSTARPLLSVGDPASRARELIEARRSAYAEAHARVTTADVDVDVAARAVSAVWKREPVVVAAGEHSYSVDVGSALLAERLRALLGRPTGMLVVTDQNVEAAHGALLKRALPQAPTLALVPGEEHKNPAALEQVWRAALDAELDRGSLFVAFGGGVVCDIAGFAAATWMRGARWLALPTTLLAMEDASVGGKTAVDLGDAKNAVGAFWQPAGVVCDIALLSTEPERGYRGALSEVVKSALVGDSLWIPRSEADAVLRREPKHSPTVRHHGRRASCPATNASLGARVLNLTHRGARLRPASYRYIARRSCVPGAGRALRIGHQRSLVRASSPAEPVRAPDGSRYAIGEAVDSF
jgi:hypothetical protein